MKVPLLLLAGLFPMGPTAQDPTVQVTTNEDGSRAEEEVIVDADGRRTLQGEATYYHANGQVRAEGRHSDGRRVGRWQGWHANGERAYTGKYQGGLRTGMWRFHDEAGQPIERLTGQYQFISQEDPHGMTRSMGYRVDGKPQGDWRVDWYNGKLLACGSIVDGRREGWWRVWHPNGLPAPLLGSGRFVEGRWQEPVPDELWSLPKHYGLDLPGPDVLSPREGRKSEPKAFQSDFWKDFEQRAPKLHELPASERGAFLAAFTAPFAGHSLGWSWAADEEGVAQRVELARSVQTLREWYRYSNQFWALQLRMHEPGKDLMQCSPLFQNLILFRFELGDTGGPLPPEFSLRGTYGGRSTNSQTQQQAVERALDWLASVQAEDGFWYPLPEEKKVDRGLQVGLTSLALLSFFGAGESPFSAKYGDRLLAGLDALLEAQHKSGEFESVFQQGKKLYLRHRVYQHAMATLAMCEAYGMTGAAIYRESAQRGLAVLEKMRSPYGGWRYDFPPKGDTDTSVTSWACQAILVGHLLGLEVDPECSRGAMEWLDSVSDETNGRVGYIGPERGGRSSRLDLNEHFPFESGEAMTAAGLAMRRMIQWDRQELEPIEVKHVELLLRVPHSFEKRVEDAYYAYYGTLAEGLVASTPKPKTAIADWRADAVKGILKQQEERGKWAGSWEPSDAWGLYAGRIFTTTMYILSIENHWRYRHADRLGR